ncbi:hypothetical protein TTHERM_00030500 (macronuclear) [Tetrahymena thermophila SB210]|uniref:EF-hand domain-containing protein n=1 Tax=Tetrahymena thermophila (strain SB210) TaxID=312017 RepID=Q22MS3_TETTS|nr:hypothetical protein TTHERM_00030500 [Tetrahymena thermophila SB210]EAR86411.1 hypothetical protein TTHERM_00030500 [Tetrahymena thermophila SB210]|eukprot:XP_976947.1 hypothetical protein TTHERM_00030500 [Tetrahymena thermophila SB210]
MKKSIVDQSNTEEVVGSNTNKMSKDRLGKPKDQQVNHSKSNQDSQQQGKHKIKYETAQQQKEIIQRNMEKYKQIFDSKFLNEGDQQQKQNSQQIIYSGRSNPAISENQQPTLSMQNDTNNTGKKLQFRYNSQGNLSPTKRHEISIIQPSNAQNQQAYAQMTSNNDLSTSFIPKNIFEDILTNPIKDNSQQVTLNAFKSVKVSSTRLEPISGLYSQGENRLADEQLRQKAQNAQQLLSQQKKLQLKSIKSNHDISYFKDQKDYRYSGHIDPQTATNTYILKNPAVLFHSSQEQKKGNVYIQMYEHSHNKEKFDTDLISIQNKILMEEQRKSVSQQNIKSHNISNILSHTGAKIMDSNKTSMQNLTQNQLPFSVNNLDSKQILQKRMSADQNNINQQQQSQSQNNSIIQSGFSVSGGQKFRSNKDILLTKPTNRSEVVELENWLTEMIDKVQLNEYMNIKEVFDQIQIIYVACMKELIRQITIQCKDRGRLLQKVWDSYLDILQRGIDQTQNSKIGEEKEYLDEVTRIHKMYDQTIKLIETELEKKKKEVKDQSKQSEQLTDAIHYFRKKVKMYEIEIKKAQQMEEELRFELEAALSENLKLKLLQGDNKVHDDNHQNYHHSNHNQSKNSNQVSLSNTVGEEQFQQQNQDLEGIKSIQQINFENALSKKSSVTNLKVVEKKSKVSVVSHLINFNKRNMVEDEDDEKKKKDYLNSFKYSAQEKDAMSDDSDIFGKNEEKESRQNELEFFMEEEKKLADLKIPELELFDIVETGVQTDEIKISENEHINFLIKELSQNSIFADSSPELTKIYTNSYQIVKQSALDLSQKETILNALDHCKLQVVTYEKLAYVNGQLASKNTELQQQTLDLGIQLKEVEQNYQDKKRRWKKRALTYIEKIKSQEEQIQTLESTTEQMEQKLLKNIKQKQMVTAVIGQLLKKPTQIQDQDKLEVLDQHHVNQDQEENILSTEELNEQKNMTDSQFIGSLILEQQQELKNLQLPEQQGLQRILSQYLSKEVLEENGEPKSREELNKLLIKLGGRRETDMQFSRGKKNKGSIIESKKLASQTKQTKRIYSQNTNQATNILENILKKRNSIKSAVVPLASIQKFFTVVYQEILKNEQAFRIPLHVSCYDILIQKHGLKRVAEDKLARIMKSVYAYKDKNIKMEMVATFLGLNHKYDETDYYYFLLGLKYFQNINHNILNLNSEHGQIVTEKAIDFINIYFQDKLEKEGFNKLITDIKMTSLQKGIELELLIKKCLFYYSERKEKYKKHIEDIFYATDLDANDQIELYEFDLIFRFIEKDIYDINKVEEIFFDEADNINPSNGEKALSLNKFVNLCVQKNLFSQEKCQAFNQNFKEHGVATNFEQLKENASEYKKQIKNRFLKAGKFMSEIKQIIKTLFKLIAEPSPQRPNSLWVSYLLMEKESRSILIDFEANILLQNLLPVKIQMLDIIGRRFEEIL